MTHSQQLTVPGTTTGARRRRPVRIVAPIVNTYAPVADLGHPVAPHVHGVESAPDRDPEQQAS